MCWSGTKQSALTEQVSFSFRANSLGKQGEDEERGLAPLAVISEQVLRFLYVKYAHRKETECHERWKKTLGF